MHVQLEYRSPPLQGYSETLLITAMADPLQSVKSGVASVMEIGSVPGKIIFCAIFIFSYTEPVGRRLYASC